MKRSPVLITVVFLLAAFSSVLLAQSTTSLRGVVKDPKGSMIPGASITLTDNATGETYHSISNGSGYYIFPVVTPATYLITIDSSGFAEQKRTAQLLVNQPATIDFTMSIKAESVTVDVSATAQTLNFTDASLGNSVNNVTIQALPMEGRDPASLLSLQPGVLYFGAATSGADSRQGAVAGGRSDQANVMLDGIDDNDQLNGTALSGVLRSTLDSTEEFRVTTSNGTAEAGRSSGAQVSLVTKSGTNQYKGALYEYYRPTNTVANDYFHKNQQYNSGQPNVPQKYVQNVFGGSLGGPVKKDKLFFFFNYEGLRRAIDSVVSTTLPTQSFMQGNLQYTDVNGNNDTITATQMASLDAGCASPANYFNGATVCPWGAGVDPNILAYYANAPVATGSATGDGLNNGSYFFTSPAPFTQNTSILKIDYAMNNANRLFARGNLQKDTNAGAENLPGQLPSSFTDDNTKGFMVGHTWTPTANIVNDVRYGFIRQGYQIGGIGQGDYVFVRFLTQPTAQTRNTIQHVPVHNIVDTMNWTHKEHTFSFGGNWRMITNEHGTDANSFNGASTNPYWPNINTLPTPDQIGLPALSSGFLNSYEIAYATLVGEVSQLTNIYNYAVSSPTSGTALADGAFVQRNFRSNEFEYFGQDSWRIRPNLTVTFGLRHTLLQTPYEMNGQQVSPTIDTDAWYKKRESEAQQGQIYEPLLSFAPSGKANHAPPFFPMQKLNIAPRLGIVYAPDTKTTIRAGFGMYFDHYGEGLINSFDQEGSFGLSSAISNAAGAYGFENSPRFTGPHNLPAYPMPSSGATQSFPYTPPSSPADGFSIAWGLDNHLKTPYSYSFNLSTQRELPAGFTVEADYVGRLGRHLLEQLDMAEPVDFVDANGGGDYFSAARKLSQIVDANGSCNPYNAASNNCNVPTVAPIQYFEDIFPFMQGYDYAGESATQAIYNNEWATNRDTAGETFALYDLDFSGYYPGSPNSGSGAPPSKFWQNQFSSLYAWTTIGTSSYNALNLILRHPSSHGFTFDFNWTYSKSIDMNSGTERANELGSNGDNGFTSSAIQNSWNPKLNKAVSDFDTKHIITFDWVYELPVGRGKAVLANSDRVLNAVIGGWQWSGIYRWTTGLPYSFFQAGWATDWQLEGFGVQTAPVRFYKNKANAGLPMIFTTAQATIINNGVANGTPFRNPYPGEEGQRNSFRGDGYFEIDNSLTKTWNIFDKAKLKFTAEVYNLSNTPRFDVSPTSLNTGLTSGTLGTYSYMLATYGYRRMEFGLRAEF